MLAPAPVLAAAEEAPLPTEPVAAAGTTIAVAGGANGGEGGQGTDGPSSAALVASQSAAGGSVTPLREPTPAPAFELAPAPAQGMVEVAGCASAPASELEPTGPEKGAGETTSSNDVQQPSEEAGEEGAGAQRYAEFGAGNGHRCHTARAHGAQGRGCQDLNA
jgi:hypothetical protein